jgi:hypothetical protein
VNFVPASSEYLKPTHALSIQQPWAWLIVNGHKDVENRSWPLPWWIREILFKSNYKAGYRVFIHAGKTIDKSAGDFLAGIKSSKTGKVIAFPPTYETGGIIGEVSIVRQITTSSNVEKSHWFRGEYGFALAHPEAYDKIIPCRGFLGFFKPKI